MKLPDVPYRLERFTLAVMVLGLTGGVTFILSRFEVPAANRDVIFQLVGGLIALSGMVITDYFRNGTKVEIKDADPRN